MHKYPIELNDKDLVDMIDEKVDKAQWLIKKLHKNNWADRESHIKALDNLHEARLMIDRMLKAHNYSPTMK